MKKIDTKNSTTRFYNSSMKVGPWRLTKIKLGKLTVFPETFFTKV